VPPGDLSYGFLLAQRLLHNLVALLCRPPTRFGHLVLPAVSQPILAKHSHLSFRIGWDATIQPSQSNRRLQQLAVGSVRRTCADPARKPQYPGMRRMEWPLFGQGLDWSLHTNADPLFGDQLDPLPAGRRSIVRPLAQNSKGTR
jgi:hypothetical protein